MADTMSFALLGVAALHADAAAGALRLSSCAGKIKEPRSAVLRAHPRRATGACSQASLRHRAATMAVCLRDLRGARSCSCRSSAPSSCRTSTKARCGSARRCPTRSRSRRRRSSGRSCATLLLRFPQVTTVANEHGRPDDGTDPIGFFNDEYFVGLKPYDDPAWSGAIRTKAQLIDAIQEKLEAFPGIIFNYTQPAEDAVDEAETGLKSSLAVKIFGPDLDDARGEGRGGAATVLATCPASRTSRWCGSSGSRASRSSRTARRSRATASTSPTSTR